MNRRRLNRGRGFFISRAILIREKKLIERHYDFLQCSISGNLLVCRGKVKPTSHSKNYEIKVVYDPKVNPKVFVVNPLIEYNDDIHMFKNDKSLCLFHSETDNFYWDFRKHHLFDTIVPWTLEWLIYYELYLISGKWEHPFVDHRNLSNVS